MTQLKTFLETHLLKSSIESDVVLGNGWLMVVIFAEVPVKYLSTAVFTAFRDTDVEWYAALLNHAVTYPEDKNTIMT